jgi:hypothetical protein
MVQGHCVAKGQYVQPNYVTHAAVLRHKIRLHNQHAVATVDTARQVTPLMLVHSCRPCPCAAAAAAAARPLLLHHDGLQAHRPHNQC